MRCRKKSPSKWGAWCEIVCGGMKFCALRDESPASQQHSKVFSICMRVAVQVACERIGNVHGIADRVSVAVDQSHCWNWRRLNQLLARFDSRRCILNPSGSAFLQHSCCFGLCGDSVDLRYYFFSCGDGSAVVLKFISVCAMYKSSHWKEISKFIKKMIK